MKLYMNSINVVYVEISALLSMSCICQIKRIYCMYSIFRRRTSQMWQRSCLRRALRRVVTISPTPKAQKTTAVPSHKRAGEEDGCEEVQDHKLQFVYYWKYSHFFWESNFVFKLYQRGRASFLSQYCALLFNNHLGRIKTRERNSSPLTVALIDH